MKNIFIILLLIFSITPAYSDRQFTRDYNFEVRQGNISGVVAATTIGHANDVGTSPETLQPGTGSARTAINTLIGAPATVTVSSTSANDTNTAGTGLRTLLLSGLDSNNDPISETITMNGTTAVTSANTYKFVQSMVALTAGTTASNEGTVYAGIGTVTSGKPANVAVSMEVGANNSTSAVYMVPNGYSFYPRQVSVILGDSTKFITVEIYLRNVTTGLYIKALEIPTSSGYWIQPVQAFTAQAAGTVIEIQASVDAGTASATVALAGYLK